MLFRSLARLKWAGLAVIALGAAPALAQSANFDTLTLTPGFGASDAAVSGFTGGSVALASIANRDVAGTLCLGYADSAPDHILVLQEDFDRLTLQVDSGGNDTTLLIQGPNNGTIRCGDDTGRNKDASVRSTNWGAGEYRVWVGSFDPNTRYDYTLRASQQ